VFKKPALSDKKEKRFTDNKKPGAVVDQYIKDVKEEVQKEKKKLKLEEK
jgi:hypothetical protein